MQVFPAQGQAPSKVAVKNLTAAVGRGEVLGLLGPNGAGKTTSISMLVGFLEPTSGGAVINGLSIAEDMDNIYSQMGVCPQVREAWSSAQQYREHRGSSSSTGHVSRAASRY